MVPAARPSPSVPSTMARFGSFASCSSSMLTERSLRAIAAVLKPREWRMSIPFSGQSAGVSPNCPQGTWNTVPMLTRTARRQSGSQQEGLMRTASMFSAAAERKMAPTLVESTMPSSTATRRAFLQSSSTGRGAGRWKAQRTPRVSSKPVSSASISRSAVYTGASPQRLRMPAAGPVICLRSISRDTGL